MKIRFLPYFFLSILTAFGQVNTAHLTGTTGNVQTNIDARVLGSGTTGTVPKLTGTNTIGNSTLTESGTTVTASGNVTVTGNLTAKQGDLPSSGRAAGVSGGVQFGATSGSRAESVMTGQAIGTNAFTMAWRMQMPTALPAATQWLTDFRVDVNNRIISYVSTGGGIAVYAVEGGVISTTAVINATATMLGQIIDIAAVRSGTNMSLYLNGSLVTSINDDEFDVNLTSAATVSFGSSNGLAGFQGLVTAASLFNRALSAADVLSLSLYGINAADEWGTMVPLYSSDFSAGVDGWTTIRSTVTGNIDGIGGQDNVLRVTTDATASNSHYGVRSQFVIGKRYRVSAKCFIPSSNAVVNQFRYGNESQYQPYITTLDTWVSSEFEITAIHGNLNLFMANTSTGSSFTGNGTDVVYVKDIIVTPIGALIDLDMATGGGTTLTDRSANRLDATLYGAYTHIAPVRESIIESGTLTASNPALTITQTWNNGAVTFDGLTYTLTDTASAAGSRFMVGNVGTSRKWSIGKDGSIDIWGTYTDTSNYRHLDFLQSSGGAATIQSKGLGTGLSGNTLSLGANSISALDIAADGDATFNYDLNAASGTSSRAFARRRGRLRQSC
jgi:hypothetical protein